MKERVGDEKLIIISVAVRGINGINHYVIKGRSHCVIKLDKGNEVHRVFPKKITTAQNSPLSRLPSISSFLSLPPPFPSVPFSFPLPSFSISLPFPSPLFRYLSSPQNPVRRCTWGALLAFTPRKTRGRVRVVNEFDYTTDSNTRASARNVNGP